MRKTMIMLLGVLWILSGLTACNDENDNSDTGFKAADILYFPRNEYPVIISKDLPVRFEWAYSKSNDYIFITYEVLFDKADGNFSHPLYTITSLNDGISPEVTVEAATMDLIAKNAGAGLGETVELKWTVRAQKHKETVVYGGESGVRTIFVTRPAPPLKEVELRILGTATERPEAGIKLGQAMTVEDTKDDYSLAYTPGMYECFTELKSGEWYLYDEGNNKYYELLADGTINQTDEAVKSTNSYNSQCWLLIDFAQMKWSIKEIDKVEFFNRPWFGSSSWKTMDYEGNGVWSVTDYAWNIGNGNQYDSRYAAKVTYKNKKTLFDEERWGYRYKDCNDFNNALNDPSFFKIHRYTFWNSFDSNAWHGTWKTANDNQGYNQLATFRFYMNHDKGYYTHERSFKSK